MSIVCVYPKQKGALFGELTEYPTESSAVLSESGRWSTKLKMRVSQQLMVARPSRNVAEVARCGKVVFSHR